jgi:serine phosphatase RsbU (regulator of sigma subunit)/DNA-binding response OmpR family regulator
VANKTRGKILIIDDDDAILTYLKLYFTEYHFECILADSGRDAVQKFKDFSPDVVICDLRLPDIMGDAVVKALKEINALVPIIIITGLADEQLLISAMNNGAIDILKKPILLKDLNYLLNKIESIFRRIVQRINSSFILWDKKLLRIHNDISVIPAVVDYVFSGMDFLTENDSFLRIGFQEILLNAIEHGNLEIDFELKDRLLQDSNYLQELTRRQVLAEFKERFVTVRMTSRPTFLKIVVEDMGKGFDVTNIPNTTSPETYFKEFGKGIFMAMKAFDIVKYNKVGNSVTLIKYAEWSGESKEAAKLATLSEATEVTVENDSDSAEISLELSLAADFQRTFLPQRETIKNFSSIQTDFLFKPVHLVSGDFIDVTKLDEQIYGFFISDISGHGVAAALISAMLKVFFSLYAKDVLSPQLIFEILNTEFFNYLNSGEYFSSFYGIYFADENKFVFTNANHPPPLLLRKKSADLIELNSEGFFVGIFKEAKFEEKEYILETGDRILFFTDGILEAQNAAREQFGSARLQDIFKQLRDAPFADVLPRIERDIIAFTAGQFADDYTVALFEVR